MLVRVWVTKEVFELLLTNQLMGPINLGVFAGYGPGGDTVTIQFNGGKQ